MSLSLVDAIEAQADALEIQVRVLRALALGLRRRGDDAFVDVAEASRIMRRTPRYVRSQITRGTLPARGEGRGVLILRSDLDAWLRALPPRAVRTEQDDVDDDEVDRLADQLRAEAP